MARKTRKVIEKVEITGIADKGRSVGRSESGKVIFVEDVAPGDNVDVLVKKERSDYIEGTVEKYNRYSEDRVDPFCKHYGVCGGCRWQHIRYDAQLRHKNLMVENAIKRIAKMKVDAWLPILPAARTEYYRNKLEFAFSNKRWLTKEEIDSGIPNTEDVLGFHRPAAFDKIVDIEHCYLQEDPSNELRLAVKQLAIEQGLSFFDLRAQTGMMRHILIRITTLGEVMLIVSFFEEDQPAIKRLLDSVQDRIPQITTIFYCINSKPNDYILDLEMVCYSGKGYIEERLGEVRFKIGPKSFFQTNSRQAEALYDEVVNFAELTGTENVYDLYTGLGSIALYIARSCRQVVGIEEVADAIRDAKENAALNDIQNALFYAGDVKNVLTPEFAVKHGKPDVLITDPPRAGMHPEVVQFLLQLAPPKIVYVSCNPSTQARDLNLLAEKYDVKKIRPVDMFPHTYHVETIALLQIR